MNAAALARELELLAADIASARSLKPIAMHDELTRIEVELRDLAWAIQRDGIKYSDAATRSAAG